jgi:hypothetical protein
LKDGKLIELPSGEYFDKELFAFITMSDSSIDIYALSRISSIRIDQQKTIDVSALKKNVKIYEAELKDGTLKYINYSNKYDKASNSIIIENDDECVDFDSIKQARLDEPRVLCLDSLKPDSNYAAAELLLTDAKYYPIKNIKISYWGPYFADADKTMCINYDRVDLALAEGKETAMNCLQTAVILSVMLLIIGIALFVSSIKKFQN